ncbi:PREDICTED: uncharacterized protein LOC105540980 [Mandrillus leucophaeus]|uniref:uncharacterized protein LOC105540980 n=1 Tax=Mandrillus leucophaeus TaxID=9568 RepID=UPI0005F4E199|nr:PREDICTED: uncharacterized protein LOC105540980 [Mandrillus leucophaeus]
MCIYVYMCVYMHMCVCIYVCCVYIYACACVCIYVDVCMRVHHTCVHVCINVYVCMCMHKHNHLPEPCRPPPRAQWVDAAAAMGKQLIVQAAKNGEEICFVKEKCTHTEFIDFPPVFSVCECTRYLLTATRRGLAATEIVLGKRPGQQSPCANGYIGLEREPASQPCCWFSARPKFGTGDAVCLSLKVMDSKAALMSLDPIQPLTIEEGTWEVQPMNLVQTPHHHQVPESLSDVLRAFWGPPYTGSLCTLSSHLLVRLSPSPGSAAALPVRSS